MTKSTPLFDLANLRTIRFLSYESMINMLPKIRARKKVRSMLNQVYNGLITLNVQLALALAVLDTLAT